MSSPNSLDRLATQYFDERFKRKSSESFLSQPGSTIWVSRHRSLRTQYLHFGVFFLKAMYNSCKLQRPLQAEKFFFMYSVTYTNILFLFRHLPTEIGIFINVCYQKICFSGDSPSFFTSRFCKCSTYFFYFM